MGPNGRVVTLSVPSGAAALLLPANRMRDSLTLVVSASGSYNWYLGLVTGAFTYGGYIVNTGYQVILRRRDIGPLIEMPLYVTNNGLTQYITVIEGFA